MRIVRVHVGHSHRLFIIICFLCSFTSIAVDSPPGFGVHTPAGANFTEFFFFFSARPEILVSPSPRYLWSGFSGEMWIYQNTHLLLIFWNNRLRINLIIIQGVDHWIKIKWRNHFHLIRDVDYCFINVWLIRQFILINYNRRGFEGPTYKNIEFNVVVDRNFTQNKSEYQNN